VRSSSASDWTARRLARPIREFAQAAERLGVDLTAQPLAVGGPQELRTTIQAFNRMQDRVRRFLEDRTQMLAAISHDLRAPLARLRLRYVDCGRRDEYALDVGARVMAQRALNDDGYHFSLH